jgi:lysophospholipase L1-like esterase
MPYSAPMKGTATTIVLISLALAGCAQALGAAQEVTTQPPTAPITTLATVTTLLPPTTTTTAPAPPSITITSPESDIVETYVLSVAGTTSPDAALLIDGEEVAIAHDGTFEVQHLNTKGENTIEVIATSPEGLSTTERLAYTFEPGEGWVAVIGDSVMLGTKPEIEKRLAEDIVDATVSRQFLHAPALVRDLVDLDVPPEVIIVALGTNGPVQAKHFDEVMEHAADVPLVVFVNVRVPRTWEATSNRELAEGVERYENAVLVDFYEVAADRNELFAADGVHPKQTGRVILAELIAEAIFPNWIPLEDS